MKYKHYSFDLWDTLIKTTDTTFKDGRAYHIWGKYLKPVQVNRGLSLKEVREIIHDVGHEGDFRSQINGKSMDALEMLALCVFRVQGHVDGISLLNMEILYKEIEQIFFRYTPVLYDEDTKYVLEELKMRGRTISLTSNTGYIQGRTLDVLLDNLGIGKLFDFKTYSDQVNLSKPNPMIFGKVWETVNMKSDDFIKIEEIIHVGDNDIADGRGAIEAGMASMIINSNSSTIKDIL